MSTKTPPEIQRTMLTDGTVRLSGGNCSFVYRRLRPGVLLISITGDDHGQFGSASLDEVASEVTRWSAASVVFRPS